MAAILVKYGPKKGPKQIYGFVPHSAPKAQTEAERVEFLIEKHYQEMVKNAGITAGSAAPKDAEIKLHPETFHVTLTYTLGSVPCKMSCPFDEFLEIPSLPIR